MCPWDTDTDDAPVIKGHNSNTVKVTPHKCVLKFCDNKQCAFG